MKAIALGLLAMLAMPVFAAEMYRWVDDKGVVNYTPYPPPANPKPDFRSLPHDWHLPSVAPQLGNAGFFV